MRAPQFGAPARESRKAAGSGVEKSASPGATESAATALEACSKCGNDVPDIVADGGCPRIGCPVMVQQSQSAGKTWRQRRAAAMTDSGVTPSGGSKGFG